MEPSEWGGCKYGDIARHSPQADALWGSRAGRNLVCTRATVTVPPQQDTG